MNRWCRYGTKLHFLLLGWHKLFVSWLTEKRNGRKTVITACMLQMCWEREREGGEREREEDMVPSSSRNSITSVSPRPIRTAAEQNVMTQISSYLFKTWFSYSNCSRKSVYIHATCICANLVWNQGKIWLGLACGIPTSETLQIYQFMSNWKWVCPTECGFE